MNLLRNGLRMAWLSAALHGCIQDSPEAVGTWEFRPDELVFNTPVGTVDVRTFEIKNNGDSTITILISRPIGDGTCPEEPFLPIAAEVTIAPNSAQSLRIDHAPTVVPTGGSCVFRVALTEKNDPTGDRRSLRLDGGVQDVDADGDGWGRGEGDCNDRAIADSQGDGVPSPAEINPGAREACNGVDDDCDGLIDDADINEDLKLRDDGDPTNDAPPLVLNQLEFNPDVDGDGFPRNAGSIYRCYQPIGYVLREKGLTDGWDCNDQLFEIYPGAPEVPGDGVDRDCDGSVTCYADADGDGFGGATTEYPLSKVNPYCEPIDVDCEGPGNHPECVTRNAGDCNDAEGRVNPSAAETCLGPDPLDPSRVVPGVDEDCDNIVDDNDPNIATSSQDIYFNDNDGDGEGNPQIFALSCFQPAGYAQNASDCNDGNANVNTRAQESCDTIDNDCDGLIDDEDPSVDIDETAPDNQWFIDRDNDRFGDKTLNTVVRYACAQPLGYVNNQNDCDDRNATVNDFAQEEPADDVDQNCDGFEECWCDRDSDAYGIRVVVLTRDVTCNVVSVNPGDPPAACPDVTDLLGDCEDDNPDNFPGNIEDCDSQDNDCDGLIDGADGGVSADNLYFRDRDGDGYGNPGEPTIACVRPIGYAESDINHDNQVTADEVDCDDQRPSAHPNAPEIVANGIDENCDQTESCWDDNDDDGFGARPPAGQLGPTRTSNQGDLACVGPQVSASQDDCDDQNDAIRPNTVERCDPNDVDEDCDGAADDDDADPLNTTAWYFDGDNDDFGGNADPFFRCDRPVGYAPRTGDCNDASSAINPDGVEVCNGFDDDCDGGADDNDDPLVGTAINYLNPAQSRARTWYPDADGDGYGDNSTSLVLCAAPPQYVSRAGDCNDDNPEVRTGAVEIFADGVDQNCDGDDACRLDADGDGFGSTASANAALVPGSICQGPNIASTSDDCDDNDDTVNPTAPEICDNKDNDCDRRIDDRDDDVSPAFNVNAPDAYTWTRDGDADGFGDPGDVVYACAKPVGYVTEVGSAPGTYAQADCNDDDRRVYPGAAEEPANGIDESCNGLEACYWDGDLDGFGVVAGVATPIREAPSGRLDCVEAGYSANTDDCDDSDDDINPNGIEICNSVDDDCDRRVDDADPSRVGGTFFYLDADLDGDGNPSILQLQCAAPAGFVANADDCNDNNSQINSRAQERCDLLNTDEDCDGLADDLDNSTSAATKQRFYDDLDRDGEGAANDAGDLRCDPAPNEVDTKRDCNDADPGVRPGAADAIADNVDSDCDGFERCYCNKDGDDFGADGGYVDVTITTPPPANNVCSPPTNPPALPAASCASPNVPVAAFVGDCDDNNANVGLAETAYFLDSDGDNYGNPSVVIVSCQPPASGTWVTNPLDCADNNGLIHPGGQEICDPSNRDEDCDGFSDDLDGTVDSNTFRTFRPDNDFDGFGDDNAADIRKCDADFNEVATTGDCDDSNAAVKPGVFDVPADNLDADCDGKEKCYCNRDGDAYGDGSTLIERTFNPLSPNHVCAPPANPPASVAPSCAAPNVSVALQTGDCDDTNAATGSAQTLWFYDADGDLEGNPSVFLLQCTSPGVGWTTVATDCDDSNSNINRTHGAQEVCDAANKDEDCDGLVEDADASVVAGTKSTWFVDSDGDRYGGSVSVQRCDPTPTQVAASGDCNDADAGVNPAAVEAVADNVDGDCDGQELCYCNKDGDALGISSSLVSKAITPPPAGNVCAPPASPPASPAATCSSTTVAIVPGDCNDSDKNSVTGATIRFLDDDGDGFGNPDVYVFGCEVPPGTWVVNPDDCNDAVAAIKPTAPEVCDFVDNNCNGAVDEGAQPSTWWQDRDSDTTGNPAVSVVACTQPSGFVARGSADCNDDNAAIKPGASEVCDFLDNDCDGLTDETAPPSEYWQDRDGDGAGNPDVAVTACAQPPGFVLRGVADCNDDNAAIKPSASEVCDFLDNDCDGLTDETGAPTTWWRDADADTFGNPNIAVTACAAPSGFVAAGQADCNDAVAAIKPGAAETCDRLDNNCNGGIDEGLALNVYWRDADADTFGTPAASIAVCNTTAPAGYVTPGQADCDDTSNTRKPGVNELCNGTDDNCNGGIDEPPLTGGSTYYADFDGDGFGLTGSTVVACAVPPGYALLSGDCIDAGGQDRNPLRHPGRPEVCDDIDNDCDANVDEDAIDQVTLWTDGDGDGFGDPATAATGCASIVTGVPPGIPDCDDLDEDVFPGAGERCNAVDDDCNRRVDDGAYCGPLAYGFEDVVTGTAYQLVEQQLSWDSAEDYCDAIGYHLAWLETTTEEANVGAAVGARSITQFWLGYYREPAAWRRASGPSTSLTTAAIGDAGSNEAVQIAAASNWTNKVILWDAGTWTDLARNGPAHAFVCEAPP
ncbi:MAG TPA: MopE-related protein [Myxococcota bacterium]|nr:MopE-related protein [Myxococcota bacterium]